MADDCHEHRDRENREGHSDTISVSLHELPQDVAHEPFLHPDASVRMRAPRAPIPVAPRRSQVLVGASRSRAPERSITTTRKRTTAHIETVGWRSTNERKASMVSSSKEKVPQRGTKNENNHGPEPSRDPRNQRLPVRGQFRFGLNRLRTSLMMRHNILLVDKVDLAIKKILCHCEE